MINGNIAHVIRNIDYYKGTIGNGIEQWRLI